VARPWSSPPSDNPYVGGMMHKEAHGAELNGRALRRALDREYGQPNKNVATKKKRKKR
jgi:hypothetical protein